MKPETVEWINKAEGDWAVAQREMQAPDPVWNVICFLAQQCAEKYQGLSGGAWNRFREEARSRIVA